MIGMDGKCPFEFNFDPSTFKVGDTVSYRVPALGDFPFAAVIKAVHEDYIEIADCGEPDRCFISSPTGQLPGHRHLPGEY